MTNAAKYRENLADIRARMLRGYITVAEAKAEAQPILDEMNTKGKELAKKYSKTFKPLNIHLFIKLL